MATPTSTGDVGLRLTHRAKIMTFVHKSGFFPGYMKNILQSMPTYGRNHNAVVSSTSESEKFRSKSQKPPEEKTFFPGVNLTDWFTRPKEKIKNTSFREKSKRSHCLVLCFSWLTLGQIVCPWIAFGPLQPAVVSILYARTVNPDNGRKEESKNYILYVFL